MSSRSASTARQNIDSDALITVCAAIRRQIAVRRVVRKVPRRLTNEFGTIVALHVDTQRVVEVIEHRAKARSVTQYRPNAKAVSFERAMRVRHEHFSRAITEVIIVGIIAKLDVDVERCRELDLLLAQIVVGSTKLRLTLCSVAIHDADVQLAVRLGLDGTDVDVVEQRTVCNRGRCCGNAVHVVDICSHRRRGGATDALPVDKRAHKAGARLWIDGFRAFLVADVAALDTTLLVKVTDAHELGAWFGENALAQRRAGTTARKAVALVIKRASVRRVFKVDQRSPGFFGARAMRRVIDTLRGRVHWVDRSRGWF
mmetsp:Transcript_4605/g.12448  ORF Transcript_4605/g.12448 Transcript_4605/m.12448 type:complete len:314 (+) Transcript_4605:226-1167(+)